MSSGIGRSLCPARVQYLSLPGRASRTEAAIDCGGVAPVSARVIKAAMAVAVGMATATTLHAQGWRLRVDANAHVAAFRGVELDSVPGTDVVAGPTGGPVSPDGIIARCPATSTFCYIYRPGEERRGGPTVTTADLSLWGLGVPGLRAHVRARAGFQLGNADAWPGTDPALQLLEAYAEYSATAFTARAGRQVLASRLGWQGFDGARVTGRSDRLELEGEVYAGLGLDRASMLPVTSPALDPLDEFRPQSRQLVVGGAVGWRPGTASVRLEYQREVDRDTRHFWSERAALSGAWNFATRWNLTAGTEYDFSNSWFGSSDIGLAYTARRVGVDAGVRQYRPYFPLWTIWGAFSPVPYQAAQTTLRLSPGRRVQLSASTEYFHFLETETETPLVQVDDDGWRTEVSARVSPSEHWLVSAGYRLEYGPGASADGFDGRIAWRGRQFTAAVYGAVLTRPLEFRLDQSELVVMGLDATWQPQSRLQLSLGAAHYAETRDRPDEAAFDWNQFRLHARATLVLSSIPDASSLPPAIRRAPASGER